MRKIGFAIVLMLPWLSVTAAELPQGWFPIGDQGAERYELDVDVEHGYSGRGLRVSARDDVPGNFGGVGQSISAEDYRGKKVRVSVWLRTDGVDDGYAGVWFRIDRNQDVLVLDNMNDRGVQGTTDWQPYASVLYVDPSATRIVFGALVNGSGVMYADEFSVEIVPDSTPIGRTTCCRKLSWQHGSALDVSARTRVFAPGFSESPGT